VRASELTIELDEPALAALSDRDADGLRRKIAALMPAAVASKPLRFAHYRTGSAFLTATSSRVHD
jgi:hypothetical protein